MHALRGETRSGFFRETSVLFVCPSNAALFGKEKAKQGRGGAAWRGLAERTKQPIENERRVIERGGGRRENTR